MTQSEEAVNRILDASLDRIGEGLRLLEDIARFSLDDAALTSQLKELRHRLIPTDARINQALLQSRAADSDVGAGQDIASQRIGLPALVSANARRVEQSLRVIEELAKTTEAGLDSSIFLSARFQLYSLEKELISRLLRQDKARLISGLYVIVDTDYLNGRSASSLAEAAIEGGARIIQLRDKTMARGKLLTLASELQAICKRYGILFIVNDHLDIALAIAADGLHLGQDDLPLDVARRLLPIDTIIGRSVTTVEQALKAQSDGADYLGVGAVYPTATKTIEVCGTDVLRQIKEVVKLPLVAIGGICAANCRQVLACGADSVVVISAVLSATEVCAAARELTEAMEVRDD